MATKSLGTLTVDILAKVGAFEKGMNAAERASDRAAKEIVAKQKQMAEKIDKIYKGIGDGLTKSFQVGMIGATAVITAGVANLFSQIGKAKDINIFAGLAQMSTEEFQKMGFAAETVNIPMEKLADMMKDFNEKLGEFKAIGSGGFADFFKEIAPFVKITSEELSKLSGQDALLAVVKSMEEAGMSSREMSFYLEALGSDMTNLLPLLVDGGRELKDLGDKASEAGAVMDQDFIDASLKAQEELNNLQWQVEGVRNEIAIQFIPILQEMIGTLNDPAAKEGIAAIVSGLGQIASKAISSAIELANFTKWVGEALAFKVNGGYAAIGDTSRAESAVADSEKRLVSLKARAKQASDGLKDTSTGFLSLFKASDAVQRQNLDTLNKAIKAQEQKLNTQKEIVRMSYEENNLTAKENEQKRKVAKEEMAKIEAQKKASQEAFALRRKEYDAARAKRDADEEAAKKKKKSGGGGAKKEKVQKEKISDEQKELDKLNDSYESNLLSIKERMFMLGKEGEAAKVSWDIQEGSLKDLNQTLKDNLLAEAQKLDAQKAAQKLAEEAEEKKEEERKNIEDDIERAKEFTENLEFQMTLLGKTADEQERLNLLRDLGSQANTEYGATAVAALGKFQEAKNVMEQQIEMADEVRSSFSGAIQDWVKGTKSFKDAMLGALESITAKLIQMAADNLIGKLLGQQGTPMGGSAGGGLGGIFGGLFGGGGGGAASAGAGAASGGGGGFMSFIGGLFGGGKAIGGNVQANSLYPVNEIGPELLTVKGKDYLMMGGDSGTITPNHRIGGGGGGGVMQSNNFVIHGKIDRRTQEQISAEVGRKSAQAQRRNY